MADNWISDVPGIRDIIDANGVTLPRVARLKLGPGLTATYSQGVITISSHSEFYADSFLFQIRTFGGGPVVLDYDGLQLPSGLDLVLDDAHLLKNGDYLWSNLGDVGFPLGPFEVPDDISDTTIDVGDAHVGRRNRCTAGAAVTINLKEESTQPIGSYVNFTQAGDGQLEFVPGDGVTALTPETLKSRKKGSTISAYRVTATHWDITGDLELDT